MRGSIRRRRLSTGAWSYQVRIPNLPAKSFRLRSEAEAYLRRTLHELADGSYVVPSTETLAVYSAHWLATIDVDVATRRNYVDALQRHILPTLGERPIGRITPQDVQALYNRKRGLGGRHLIHAALRQVFAQAVRERLIRANPCDGITLTQPKRAERPRAWDAATLARFLDLTRDEYLWPLWWLVAHTGLRGGEAVALRWQDVDLAAGELRVERTQKRSQAGPVFGPPKTAASRRTLALDAETTRVLQRQRASQAERRLAHPAWQDAGLVFDRGDGGPLIETNVNHTFTRRVATYGLPGISLHGLRSTHATLLLASGWPLADVSRRLGHSASSMTLNHYALALPANDRRIADGFAALLTERATGS